MIVDICRREIAHCGFLGLVDISIIILKDPKLQLLLHLFTIVSRVFLVNESIGLCIKLKKEARENLWGVVDNRVSI
jgi:hypothetical protein